MASPIDTDKPGVTPDDDHNGETMINVADATGIPGDASDSEAGGEHQAQNAKGRTPAQEAVLNGDLIWNWKPDPYVDSLRDTEGESLDNCERRINRELWEAYSNVHEEQKWILDQEIEIAEFEWRDYRLHWEKYLRISWDDEEGPFKNSEIKTRLKQKVDPEAESSRKASDRARQMILAKHYHEMDKKKVYVKLNPGRLWKPAENLNAVGAKLYTGNEAEDRKRWSILEKEFDETMGRNPQCGKHDEAATLSQFLAKIVESWKGWGLRVHKDRFFNNEENRNAAVDPRLLRGTPKDMIFIAVDQNGKLIAFLFPEAIQDAFRHQDWVKGRMEMDTRLVYTHIKKPSAAAAVDNKRHISAHSQLRGKYDHIGTDHYGHWHAKGRTDIPMVETKDTHKSAAIVRQAILHYLENTGGTLTKVLDFWFGVWDRDLREQYRTVYRESPKFARLPPTNPDYEETYSLHAFVINRDTDEHHDKDDWVGGLTGLVHLGKFNGGHMCLPQLGLRLDGYQSGAILLFRGAESKHYVAPWEGDGGAKAKNLTDWYQKPVFLKAEKKDRLKRVPISRKPPKDAKGKGKEKELPKRPKREDKGSNPGTAATAEEEAQAPEPLVIEEPPIDSTKQSAKRKVDDQDDEGESETRNKRSKRSRDGVTQRNSRHARAIVSTAS